MTSFTEAQAEVRVDLVGRHAVRRLLERDHTLWRDDPTELADRFALSPPAVSRHLAVLQRAGLVVSERQGQSVLYRVDRDVLLGALARFASEVDGPLRREAQAASAVESAHIVDIFDAGATEEGVPYIAFELLEGETLADRLKRAPMSPAEVVDLGVQVCQGLEAAHAAGVVGFVGFEFRFHPARAMLGRLLARGDLGVPALAVALVPDPILGCFEALELPDVGAGHEGLAPGAAEDEDADGVVGVHLLAGLVEPLVHVPRQRVAGFGAVEGERHHGALAGDEDFALLRRLGCHGVDLRRESRRMVARATGWSRAGV